MKPIRSLLVCTTDLQGGAARSSYRLLEGFDRLNLVETRMWVQNKTGDHPSVFEDRSFLGRLRANYSKRIDYLFISKIYRKCRSLFSSNIVPAFLPHEATNFAPHIFHFHWIADGFINPEFLTHFPGKVVWTLHDMWPLTGGCHFDEGCKKYLTSCGACPVLQSRIDRKSVV